MKYNYRYIARIIIEAETPIAVGSGTKNLTKDRPVAKDANGLPYIPGTSLAGVLRHAIYAHAAENNLDLDRLDDIFGFQHPKEQEKSLGSRLAISSAHLMGINKRVIDGLYLISEDEDNYEFIKRYRKLPVRKHVRISHRGAANTVNKGLFDEEVLYKGSRLIFELELKGTSEKAIDDKEKWKIMLNLFSHPDFRIGGGSTKGFGRIKVIKIKDQILNLEITEDRNFYLDHSSSLNDLFKERNVENQKELTILEQASLNDTVEKKDDKPVKLESNYIQHHLFLVPQDFFLFSSGKENETIKINQVTESIVEWDNPNEPLFSEEEKLLIPATSYKGAISHRLAFHYNRLDRKYADKLLEGETINDFVGDKNFAVKTLFGIASDYSKKEQGQKGAILFSDIYKSANSSKKLDHVAIDRFTGGPIDGALFSEKVAYQDGDWYKTRMIKTNIIENGADITIIDKYTDSIKNADNAMQNGNVITARCLYREALTILPNEKYPADCIKRIDEHIYCFEISVNKNVFTPKNMDEETKKKMAHAEEAFKKTLEDICKGNLPLGGATMRGHGVFKQIQD